MPIQKIVGGDEGVMDENDKTAYTFYAIIAVVIAIVWLASL